jgi:hypothetical protein
MQRIRVGMTEKEVEAIFQAPAGNYSDGLITAITYTGLRIVNEKVWMNDTLGVGVYFDEKGKVIHFSDVKIARVLPKGFRLE